MYMRAYLQLHVDAHVLTCARVVEQMEDSGDQSFVDAAQLAVDHALQDGAEASPFGHDLWILQGCRRRKSATLTRDGARLNSLTIVCTTRAFAMQVVKCRFQIYSAYFYFGQPVVSKTAWRVSTAMTESLFTCS